MPARRLSEIIPRIAASTDRRTLEASVAAGLAAFGVADGQNSLALAAANPDQIAYANIILGIASIRAMSFEPEQDADRLHKVGLTDRQLEVLTWAAKGKSNADIAVILGQSRRAVDYHMSEILRKLGVTSRAQAVALASARP